MTATVGRRRCEHLAARRTDVDRPRTPKDEGRDLANALRSVASGYPTTVFSVGAMISVPCLQRNLFQTLTACGLFRRAAPDVVSIVAESVHPVYFPRRHCVFAQGDAGDSLYLIASGKVKLTYRWNAGGELIVSIAGPGDMFGEIAAF